jgi:hypothetical protein
VTVTDTVFTTTTAVVDVTSTSWFTVLDASETTRTSTITTSIASTTTTTAAATPTVTPQVVVNGGFDSGSLVPWQGQGSVVPDGYAGSAYQFRSPLLSANVAYTITQLMSTSASTRYDCTFQWLWELYRPGGARVFVYVNNALASPVHLLMPAMEGQWQQGTFSFTASGSDRVNFYYQNLSPQTNTFHLDAVTCSAAT